MGSEGERRGRRLLAATVATRACEPGNAPGLEDSSDPFISLQMGCYSSAELWQLNMPDQSCSSHKGVENEALNRSKT